MENPFYYHASQVDGLSILKPHISNHGVPLVYLSKKRENALVYLSNAIENTVKKQGSLMTGITRSGVLMALIEMASYM